MPTPTGLAERLSSGENRAFNEVYTLFHERLYRYLHRLTGQQMLAEDLFQDTWMKLARHARTLSADANIEGWLFAVARNSFLDHRRWRAFDMRRLRALFELPRSTQVASDSALGLEEALAQLSGDDRDMLVLIAESTLDLEAIAGVLEISYATLRQRLSRARARLATVMKKEGMERP